MDRETLREMILDGNAKLQMPLIWKHMTPEQQRLCLAAKAFWSTRSAASDDAIDALLLLYQTQNS